MKNSNIEWTDHTDAQPTQVISNEAAQQLLDKFAPKPKKRDRTPEELDRERAQAERATTFRVNNLLETEVNRYLLAAADRPRTHADLVGIIMGLAGWDWERLAELSQADQDAWVELEDEPEVQAGWLAEHLIAQTPETLSRIAMCLTVNCSDMPDAALHLMAKSHGMDVDATRTRLQAQVLREQNDQAQGKAGGADSDEDADA